MTESEWINYSDGCFNMLLQLGDQASDRKLRLLACSCCRAVWDSLRPEARGAITVMESFLDGRATEEQRRKAEQTLVLAGHSTRAGPTEDTTGDLAVLDTISQRSGNSMGEFIQRASIHGDFDLSTQPGRVVRTFWICTGLSTLGAKRRQETRNANRSGWRLAWHALVGEERWRENGIQTAIIEEQSHQSGLIRDIFGNPFRPVSFDPEWRTSTVVALAKSMYESRDFSTMPILGDALQDAGCEHEDILTHCRSSGPHVKGCWVVDLVLGKE